MVQKDTNSIIFFFDAQFGKYRLKTNYTLAPFTTFKSGGPAEYYFEAESEDDLIHAFKIAKDTGIGVVILGGASNVVIDDDGIKGLVIRNRFFEKKILKEDATHAYLKVSSGYPITRLSKETAQMGLSGLEYHVGLPGTVGGALYMNSKWTKPVCYVGDVLHNATLISKNGDIKTVDRDYFEFGYDQSILQKTHEIVVSAVFKLKKTDPSELMTRGQDALAYRKQTQPFGVATSGCFFRNVNGQSAGELIDKAGLKGFSIGGAKVSDKHANFIVNTHNAKTADVVELVNHIKNTVKKRYNVSLQEEVIFI